MRFRYVATDSKDNAVSGEIVSEKKSVAIQELENRNLRIKFIQSVRPHKRKSIKEFFKQFLPRPHSNAFLWKNDFFEQLSMLLTAGLPIDKSLTILANGNSQEFRKIVHILREKIYSGMSLSAAMISCGGIFSRLESRIISAAEKIGHPELALQRLCNFGKKMQRVHTKIKSAMIYPMIVLATAGGALILLTTTIIPKLEFIFSPREGVNSLPWLTQKVIKFCHGVSEHWLKIVLFSVIFVLLTKIVVKTKRFRNILPLTFSRTLSKLPILGKLYIQINGYNFFQTVGMLMEFGIPTQEALVISHEVITDHEFRRSFASTLQKIKQGESLSTSFKGNRIISVTDHGLIFAGEKSGTLTQSFLKISDIYGQKLEYQLTLLTVLIEPIVIILLAIVVGIVVIAMFLPMIGLMQNIKM